MKKSSVHNQRGAALVTSLMIMSLLTVLGFSALNNSDIELKISGNERVSAQAFEAAEAGVEMAIAELRAGQLTTPRKVWSEYPGAVSLTDGTFPLVTESEVGAGKYGYQIYDNSTTEVSRAFIASTGRAGNDRSVRNLLVEVERNLAGSILDYAIYADEDLNLGNKSRVLSYRSDKTLHLTTDTDATGDHTDTFDAETLEADIGSNTEINVGNFTYIGGDISLGADVSDVDATYTATGSNSVVLGVDSFETVDGELVLSDDAYKGRVEVDELFTGTTLLAQAIQWLRDNHSTFSKPLYPEKSKPDLVSDHVVVTNDGIFELSEPYDKVFELSEHSVKIFDRKNIIYDGDTLKLRGYEIEYIDLIGKNNADEIKILTIENNGTITIDDDGKKTKDQINQINLFISYNEDNKDLSLNLSNANINIETPVQVEKFTGYIGEIGKNYTKGELSTSIIVDDIGNTGNILKLCEETGETYCSADEDGTYSILHEGRRFSMLGDNTTFILDSGKNRVLRDQIFYLKGQPEGVADTSIAYSTMEVRGAGVNMYTTGGISFATAGQGVEVNNNIYVVDEYDAPVLDADGNFTRLLTEKGVTILGPPTVFSLYSTTTGSIRFATKTVFSGLIYTPYAEVLIDNKAGFQGSVIAKTFTMTNEGSFLYDASLRPTDEERDLVSIKKLSWLEK